ncbi:outer membrane beta-barrel protein [Roseobacter sp. YSTF-M11]|uniref:Outer membrane beta-barrel protein n=1 Tax=Roseobacter insulae TaxID=2859783 RepID=A0A9X1FVJ0_9RHOB|nr:OmpW family outer membrane protein [Roseobacter insulae]MBW4707890.1 outer membrane beta-barrel protein [Roseobacter insulae]
MKITAKTLLMSSALALFAAPALAQSQGDWTIGLGLATINPKSGNGTLAGGEADIGDDESITFTFEYFIRDNLGIELLAATPFEHDISIAGIGAAGSTKHLPPTLSLNYHFPTATAWKPYVGAGINYTTFFDEESPLGTLELDNSWGFSVQAGVDYQISDAGAVRLNVRWFDIDADARLNGAAIGTAEIDPFLFGIAYVHRF